MRNCLPVAILLGTLITPAANAATVNIEFTAEISEIQSTTQTIRYPYPDLLPDYSQAATEYVDETELAGSSVALGSVVNGSIAFDTNEFEVELRSAGAGYSILESDFSSQVQLNFNPQFGVESTSFSGKSQMMHGLTDEPQNTTGLAAAHFSLPRWSAVIEAPFNSALTYIGFSSSSTNSFADPSIISGIVDLTSIMATNFFENGSIQISLSDSPESFDGLGLEYKLSADILSATTTITPSEVPLPASFYLFGATLLGLIGRKKFCGTA